MPHQEYLQKQPKRRPKGEAVSTFPEGHKRKNGGPDDKEIDELLDEIGENLSGNEEFRRHLGKLGTEA